MAGPANEVERPIHANISSTAGRRRAQALAAAVLVVANVIGLAAFLNRPEPEARRAIDIETAATPAWRVETGLEATDRPPPSADHHEPAPETPALSPADAAAEVVTPESIRAANTSPCSPDPNSWVNVRQFGAKGNGKADDTEAIQKANDAVAKRGGGRVVFDAGLYRAKDVRQDSCVAFTGTEGAALIHPDGTSPEAIIEGRLRSTTGSIGQDSRVLRAQPTPHLRPGALVAIQAAGGRSPIQRTQLRSALAPHATAVVIRDTDGWQRTLRNYLFIGGEIISYKGISGNMLLNVERGRFGSKPVHHPAGTLVAQAQRLKAVVVRVRGNRITLDRRSSIPIQGADVSVGAVGMTVEGLTLNGNRRSKGAEGVTTTALRYPLARWVTIRDNTLKRGPHGGVSLDKGTSDSIIEGNDLIDNGDVVNTSGAAIWLFRGPERNVVRENRITGQTYAGVVIDDRSVSSTDFDAYGVGNTVEGNTIDISRLPPRRNAGVVVDGSYGCRVLNNTINNTSTGVIVSRVTQGTLASVSHRNSVRHNMMFGHRVGIDVSGSDNEFIENEIRGTQKAWTNAGQRNRFIDNEVES